MADTPVYFRPADLPADFKPRITLGIYNGASASNTTPYNIAQMISSLYELDVINHQCPVIWSTSCRVDSNRNFMIDDFVHKATGATHLFIIDDDMEHPPSMAYWLAMRNKPVISGLYFHRGKDHYTPQFYRYIGQGQDNRRGHGTDWNDTYEPMTYDVAKFLSGLKVIPETDEPIILGNNVTGRPVDGGLMRIDAGGFGCLLISREAAEALDPPYLRDQPALNGDFTFYKQCREKGIEVWGDASLIAAHHAVENIGVAKFANYWVDSVTKMQQEVTGA